MAKSELIDKLREAWTAANPGACVLDPSAFFDFATKWLVEQGIVGVGHAASGIALRLADGREIGLVEHEPQQNSAQTYPVHISTVKATPRGTIPGETADQQITGR